MSVSLPFTYRSSGRRPATAITVAGIWALLIAAYLLLEATPVILGFLAAFTVPALYDLLRNPQASFTLDATRIRWQTPRQQADIALSEIDHLRFDTRLDLSVRLSVVRPSGVKIRVPYAATPPPAQIDRLAQAAGLKTRHHHFSLMG